MFAQVYFNVLVVTADWQAQGSHPAFEGQPGAGGGTATFSTPCHQRASTPRACGRPRQPSTHALSLLAFPAEPGGKTSNYFQLW